MYQISDGLDTMMTNLLVKQMLNPFNKDFYIRNLTIDKVKSMLAEMQSASPSIVDIFWKAFYTAKQSVEKVDDNIEKLFKE